MVTITFALYDIVKGLFIHDLALAQSENKIFVVFWKHKALECTFVPMYLIHGFNSEGHYSML